MQFNLNQTRHYLREADFNSLFIDGLGWDRHQQSLTVTVDETAYVLTAIVEKRGMVFFECATTDEAQMPNYSTRRKIQRKVAESVHEHVIIYTDAAKTTQIWQWVKREQGKPDACREHRYHHQQTGDAILQKLKTIAFSLAEEEGLTLPDVTGRVRAAFDVERVTKRFYERFKKAHDAFLTFLKGIPDGEMQQGYVSVMLNRLMFIYFIQKKGCLNGDADYLRTNLTRSKAAGTDRFYKTFLCPLFFQGFATPETERTEETNRLLGEVPYLNGGIFQRHQIEQQHGEAIHISDAAFEQLFAFFEQYQWHLDERPLRNDNEINPDVLGYIFEKYINQKQMGAYYTQEDITEYISKNTLIPFLFDAARKGCKVAFEGDASVWHLLQTNPDRYIYDAVKTGAQQNLPPEIALGIDDVSQRAAWNTLASDAYALPTEIWREVVARRQRYEQVRAKLANGEIADINALITENLNIRQFAQDVIEHCEGPELLRAFWNAITQVTILDPTCGSGAFLFAALNILEPLYEACLERMQAFVDEAEPVSPPSRRNLPVSPPHARRAQKYPDFRDILARIAKHPNRRYFILKSIIINNLYGVDIMDEAVEICKLRLFLKMVAQLDDVNQIEPLPDIDFNVQAGNTLVGYATYDEVEKAVTGRFDFDNTMARIRERAEDVEKLFSLFRQQQTELGSDVTLADKQALQEKLAELSDELNGYLAEEYGMDTSKTDTYQQWLSSHQPFHWFTTFYGILKEGGGFDVIIGNPPYLELRQIDYAPPTNLASYQSKAIHAMCVERSLQLLNPQGCMSMIVPMALVSTRRMQIVQSLLEKSRNVWYANYSWRPGKLFDTVNRALTIFVAVPSECGQTFSTDYQKWTSQNRDLLMYAVNYVEVPRHRHAFWVPKLGKELESSLLEKCTKIRNSLRLTARKGKHQVYYRAAGGLYWKVFTDFPPAFTVNGQASRSSTATSFGVETTEIAKPIIAMLSSNLFWWWYTVASNCRHLTPYDLQNFPVPQSALEEQELARLGEAYLADLRHNSEMKVRNQKSTGRTETQSFKIQKSKPIIDKIDRVLAQHYGFTDEELDFIINYDIKYRMGLGNA